MHLVVFVMLFPFLVFKKEAGIVTGLPSQIKDPKEEAW